MKEERNKTLQQQTTDKYNCFQVVTLCYIIPERKDLFIIKGPDPFTTEKVNSKTILNSGRFEGIMVIIGYCPPHVIASSIPFLNFQDKQECIPVGCVPAAR